MYDTIVWATLLLLLVIVVVELMPRRWTEGFTSAIKMDSPFWIKWMPRRGDIGPDPMEEQKGYLRELRYFAGYTDVQRLGQDHDFCRMVQAEGDPADMFFACALGGTDGLSTVKYRTPSTKDGFELSRDDYMHDTNGDGRADYCRIVKTGQDMFEAKCNPAGDTSFSAIMVTDAQPPAPIQQLLTFYDGIMFWLRFRDDMLDYAKNLTVSTAANLTIDESPNPAVTRGLEFNGKGQFLRMGDSRDMSFGSNIHLRYLRSIMFWVYFDEFQNNSHVFSFGEPNQPSVQCFIMGRGNAGVSDERSEDAGCQSLNTVPEAPSGAQCTECVDPKTAMLTSSANVNQWDCPKPELFGRIMPPLQPKAVPAGDAKTADLVYEVWDEKMRKMRIQLKNVIPLRKWVHLTISSDPATSDPWRPDINVYRNGSLVHTEKAGWLPQKDDTTHNYIGRSNRIEDESPLQNRDELFKGAMFDFRGYRKGLTLQKVQDSYLWGKQLLGLSALNVPQEDQ